MKPLRPFTLFLFIINAVLHALSPSVQASQACVVLLHGLARTENSMSSLAERLADEGYTIVNQGYHSRKGTIKQLAQPTINTALNKCGDSSPIHFVTHSLGGILVRQYLSHTHPKNIGYVVMLGPPNQGSEAVDVLAEYPGFGLVNGDAGYELGTSAQSVPNRLGPANFHVGVIAGTRTVNLILSSMIPGTDDGKVSVKRTQLKGMQDHITLPVTHTFMMNDDSVIRNTIYFLKNGRFCRVKTCSPEKTIRLDKN